MAVEYTAIQIQTVAPASNVIFYNSVIPCNKGYVIHRDGSGLFTLKGITSQCQNKARYLVTFSANIAAAEALTAAVPVSIALAINGEPLPETNSIVTVAAADFFYNVSRSVYIDVPKNCCLTISIRNTSDDIPIDVQNAVITIERVA